MTIVMPEKDAIAIAEAVREKAGLSKDLTAKEILEYLKTLLLSIYGESESSSLYKVTLDPPDITLDTVEPSGLTTFILEPPVLAGSSVEQSGLTVFTLQAPTITGKVELQNVSQ